MSLNEQIRADMVEAMKAKEKDRVSVLRMLVSTLKDEAIKQQLGALKDVKDPGAAALEKRLDKLPGFKSMDPKDQAQVRELIHEKGDFGKLVRKRLNKAISDPAPPM